MGARPWHLKACDLSAIELIVLVTVVCQMTLLKVYLEIIVK